MNMNLMFKNGKKIVDIRRDSRKTRYVIYEDGIEEKFKDVGKIKIKCSECDNISERIIKVKYFNKPLLCFSCLTKGERNPFFNKKHSSKNKQKISKSAKDRFSNPKNNPMYGRSVYDIWLEKYGKDETDKKWKERYKKQSLRMLGKNNPFYNKTHTDENKKIISEKNKLKWKNDEFKRIQSKKFSKGQRDLLKKNPDKYKNNKRNAGHISHLNQSRYKKNKPEIKFEKILQENNIEYVYSPIMGNYQYDFKIKNKRILIEVDGDYWHGNPKKYTILNHIQMNKQKRDKEKTEFAEKHNFKLYRIWESDIYDKQKIKEIINEIKTHNIN